MDEILNNLIIGETLYTTRRGINYLYLGRSNDLGIKYSIKQSQKTLPLATINAAFNAFVNGIEINPQWYSNFNDREFSTRSCNLVVLRSLLMRI